MAGTSGNQFTPPSYLSPDQQNLLVAALQSNDPNRKNTTTALQNGQFVGNGNFAMTNQYDAIGLDPLMFTPGTTGMSMGTFDTVDGTLNDTNFLDFLDNNDAQLDFEIEEVNDEPGRDSGETEGDIHDKRKTPEDGKDDDENDEPKRHESDEKVAKKPGRKPLTTEPTTVYAPTTKLIRAAANTSQKRKAQNRAAQRAFRERKEKHLKDLETKVAELEKASESANHENGLLRAQVERLQMELREYRKRLSMQAGSLGRSPPYANGIASYIAAASNGANTNNFQFEFPKFGSLPGGVFNNSNNNNNVVKPVSPPSTNSIVNTPPSNTASNALSLNDSNGMSPRSQNRSNGSISSASSPAQQNGQQRGSIQAESVNNDKIAGLYGVSGLTGANSITTQNLDFFSTSPAQQPQNNRSSTADHTTIDQSRLFQFKSSSNSTDSPSTSSPSQYGGANSSCGTSPEPSHNSPPNASKDQVNEQGYICRSGSDGEISFCEKLNMACGNPRNPVPRALSKSGNSNGGSAIQPSTAATTAAVAAITTTTPANLPKGIDYFATQNGGQFDPVLFGDYRDSQAAIVGDGDFTGGFFNDALPSAVDFASPFNWDINISTGLTPALQKPNPMEAAVGRADALVNGKSGEEEDEVVPGDDVGNMMSCHKIWYVCAFPCVEVM